MSPDIIWDLQRAQTCLSDVSMNFKCLETQLLSVTMKKLDENVTTLDYGIWSNMNLCSQIHFWFQNKLLFPLGWVLCFWIKRSKVLLQNSLTHSDSRQDPHLVDKNAMLLSLLLGKSIWQNGFCKRKGWFWFTARKACGWDSTSPHGFITSGKRKDTEKGDC